MLFTVYQIQNLTNGKRYIGHTGNYPRRVQQHVFHLRRGDHHASHLQRAWSLHSAENFEFTVVVDGLPCVEIALAVEQTYIDRYGDYNSSPHARTTRGLRYTDEARLNMSLAQRNKPKSETHKKALAAANTGKKQSPETIAKRIAKTKGLKRSPEILARMSAAHQKGQPHTAFGKTQFLCAWAREYGLNYATLRNRLVRSNLSLEEALMAPKSKGRRRDLEFVK